MSITLTTGRLVTINGVTQENDTQGVNTGYAVDFLGNTVTFTFAIGSGAPALFNIGVYNLPVSLTVNLTNGAWTSTNGFSGVIAGGPLANFVSQTKAIRNTVETFVAGNTVMSGTQVPWA